VSLPLTRSDPRPAPAPTALGLVGFTSVSA
jgi:hypothetical protein